MLYTNFIIELENAGLSVRAFADLIGMKPNSISNYARGGELPSHLGFIAVLVAELRSHGLDYKQAMQRVQTVPKKPRGRAQQGRFGGDRQTILDLDGGQT